MYMVNEHIPENVADSMRTEPWRIMQVKRETYDTFTLELKSAHDEGRFSFLPGQFNMLYVFGVGEVPISISGDPSQPEHLVHTTRAVGTVTKVMHELKHGETLGVRGPYGHHWPIDAAIGHDVVIVAGGIGLAPLRPALYHIVSQRALYGKVVLLYGTRSPEDILFRDELMHWRSRFDLDVFVTVDYGDETWRGNIGVVTNLIPKAPFDPLHTVALVCGPEVMMRFTAMALSKRGVSNNNIYVSMERNMKCAIGFCGHCQFGPHFICKDGPVYPYSRIEDWLSRWEI